MLFFLDLSLAIPLTLMVLEQKNIQYSQTVAIANAAYAAYKLIMAIKNKKSANKSKNLSIKMLRFLNLKDALVAILSLQYTLIITFDKGINKNMQILCAISTFTIWLTLIIMSIVNLKKFIEIKVNSVPKATQLLENVMKCKKYTVTDKFCIEIYDETLGTEDIADCLVSYGVGLSSLYFKHETLEDYFTSLTGGVKFE